MLTLILSVKLMFGSIEFNADFWNYFYFIIEQDFSGWFALVILSSYFSIDLCFCKTIVDHELQSSRILLAYFDTSWYKMRIRWGLLLVPELVSRIFIFLEASWVHRCLYFLGSLKKCSSFDLKMLSKEKLDSRNHFASELCP